MEETTGRSPNEAKGNQPHRHRLCDIDQDLSTALLGESGIEVCLGRKELAISPSGSGTNLKRAVAGKSVPTDDSVTLLSGWLDIDSCSAHVTKLQSSKFDIQSQ